MDNLSNVEIKDNFNLNSSQFLKKLNEIFIIVKSLLRYRPSYFNKGPAGYEFFNYKGYSEGDELKNIDWNIYLRLKELFSKEYIIEEPYEWIIIIDITPSISLYRKFLFEKILVSALSYIFLLLLDKVNFLIYPTLEVKKYSTFNKIKDLLQYIENLCTQDINSNNIYNLSNLNSIFSNLKVSFPYLKREYIIIVFSDFYDTNLFNILKFFKLKNIPILGNHIVAFEEINPPFKKGEIYLLYDIETQEHKEIFIDNKTIENYKKNFLKYTNKVKYLCKSNNVIYNKIITIEDFRDVILKCLKLIGFIQ